MPSRTETNLARQFRLRGPLELLPVPLRRLLVDRVIPPESTGFAACPVQGRELERQLHPHPEILHILRLLLRRRLPQQDPAILHQKIADVLAVRVNQPPPRQPIEERYSPRVREVPHQVPHLCARLRDHRAKYHRPAAGESRLLVVAVPDHRPSLGSREPKPDQADVSSVTRVDEFASSR